jgi:lactobin A/cerein 7B family class IIb bacteriocin
MNVETKISMLFEKRTVAELSDIEMLEVDGGSTPAVVASSAVCVRVAVAVATYLIENS